MTITVRPETGQDYRAVENLTREAFWDLYRPGCVEHYIVHQLRTAPSFIKELGLVAYCGEELVGAVFFSKAGILRPDGTATPVLSMGPLCVTPARQKQGIGSRLITAGLDKSRQLGFAGVIIYGSPAYYSRFGFRNAADYRITTATGDNFAQFMALELNPGSLGGMAGRYQDDPVFDFKADDVDLFDRSFPPKTKHVTATQLFK